MTPPLIAAGQAIPDAPDLVARYCGLTGEAWAYAFYDAVPVGPSVEPTDLLCASVMHGPVNRTHLQWFTDRRGDIAEFVDSVPADVDLANASSAVLDQIDVGIQTLADDTSTRSLLTKILHKHRPQLVVIDDRDISRRYARAIGKSGRLPYSSLLKFIAEDLASQTTRNVAGLIRRKVSPGFSEQRIALTDLRILDIAVWMDSHRSM